MPRRCIAAGCDTVSGKGYSFHKFPKDDALRRRWVSAVKRQRSNWDGPSKDSQLCSKHFEEGCFITDGVRFREEMGIPTVKRLKPDAVPTIFARSVDYIQTSSSTPTSRPLSERRHQRSIITELLSASETSVNISDEMDISSTPPISPIPHTSDSTSHAAVTPFKPTKFKNKGTQTETQGNIQHKEQVSVAVQCNLLGTEPLKLLKSKPSFDDSFATETEQEETDLDTSYCVSQEESATEDDTEVPLPHNEIKYMVYLSHLLTLFTECRSCNQHCKGEVANQMGTFISIKQECHHCGHTWKWNSQPFINDVPAGNILLSAAILFSGSTPTKSLHLLKCLQVACISERTFHHHQTKYLAPSIIHVWKHSQEALLSKCKSPVVIGADGRADSPGHSAKFGSYGIIDMSSNKVLYIELVQSNEVKSSNAMEHEGLVRTLDFLEKNSLVVGTLVTDRHKQIAKYIRETHPEITHQYDVWHISKGLKKKMARLSGNKDCSIIAEWIKSITNHLYWCAASSPAGDGNEIVKRWKSLMDHICDSHDTCYHSQLSLDERKKKWLIPGSKAYEKLSDIILNKRLYNDLEKLSPVHQTSGLEAYHSVVNHFAPKLLAFSYAGIYCRLLMAALHFNENYCRKQAVTASGAERIRIVYPKQKKGEYTPKPVPVAKTYRYVDRLIKTAIEYCKTDDDKPPLPIAPPPLADAYEHPDKDTIPRFSRYKH